ncbi:hypothetical protein [Bordetella flabilis]|uniref:Uncharacterized protein n=1 Tax=Bordetella flabilis TaxID=463014 RepID=A0A193GGU7_9BORD|nr:hypothetical protein [Bordetella flabilis]ANN78661.1 hypothetical protein BAU07_17445 [Bordetella flabilis]
MNANRRGGRRTPRALLLLGIAGVLPAAAQADPQAQAHPQPSDAAQGVIEMESVAPAWPEADTVHELLRRETRAALARRRGPGLQGPTHAADSDSQTAQPADRIDLSAIYGVGKRLHVEVVLNGRRLRYRHGRKWPDQAPDGVGVYALRAIEGSCVRLDGASGNRHVCLAPTP